LHRNHFIAVALAGGLGLFTFANSLSLATPAPAATLAPAAVPAASPPLLHTQDIENGVVQLNVIDSLRIEDFLRDLNHRKDYDAQCHNGQLGPDGPYLGAWVDRVTHELLARGYYFDAGGNLHRPGDLVLQR
jgi:hypothetical protein